MREHGRTVARRCSVNRMACLALRISLPIRRLRFDHRQVLTMEACPCRKLSRCAWFAAPKWGGLMNKLSVVLIGAAMALAHGAQAAELRVLAGGAMTAVWAEVKPKFEQASGHKLDIFSARRRT